MDFSEGKIIADHYKLIRQLGRGSFGDVWLAHNMLAGIDVAVKFYGALDNTGLDEFRNEFKIAYRLRHPNLLSINHFDIFENCPYLIMPYCEKGSVSNHIGQMDEPEIWKFISEVSSGLDFLHTLHPPIIHQDIKPDNILITSDGHYVITDFGISRSFRSTLTKQSSTLNSSGTIAYMGPERFSNKPLVVFASDIWALGATVYELMTGNLLWEGMGGCAQLYGASLPDIDNQFSPELIKLVHACMAKETWHRPFASKIHEYATAFLEHKPLPILPKPELEQKESTEKEGPDTPNNSDTGLSHPTPTPQDIVNETSKQHSGYNHSESFDANQHHRDSSKLNTGKLFGDKKSLYKIGLVAAIFIGIVLFATGTVHFISSIRQERRFILCKSVSDFERFINDYPKSSYSERARKKIAELKSTNSDIESDSEEPAKVITTRPASSEKIVGPSTQVVREAIVMDPASETKDVAVSKQQQPVSPTNYQPTEDDREFYACRTRRDYNKYLAKYPKGKHREEATNALTTLAKQSGDAQSYTDRYIDDATPVEPDRTMRDAPAATLPNNTSRTINFNIGFSNSTRGGGGPNRGGSHGGGRPHR